MCLFDTLIKMSEYKITKQFIKVKIQFNTGVLQIKYVHKYHNIKHGREKTPVIQNT